MVTKLISIFTVAGVVAAGSVAYALNAQSLNSGETSKVGTTTMDVSNKHVIIPNTVNADDSESQTSVGDSVGVAPVPDTTINSNGQNFPASGNDEKTFVPNSDSTVDPTPVASPTATNGPVLPPPPPGYKPGQGDDDEDESDDDDDRYEDHEDEESSEGHNPWEFDD